MRGILTYILAGGKGERLNPLTRDRAKPAVPFGGIYRIIDFTLSNCINSGLRRIYILIQYKSFSLQKHVLAGWGDIVSSQLGEFIDVIPAQQRISSDWYRGTADAIHQNVYTIQDHNPDLILILAGDHVYKMNYEKMIAYQKATDADMVVSCVPLPVENAVSFGVIEVDQAGLICGFREKPKNPKTIPGDPDRVFASMGIYLFKKDVLLQELEIDARSLTSEHDFGKNVIPQMLKNGKKIVVYNFVDKDNKPGYWRDIGTRDAYYQANMDLVRRTPDFNLFDRSWPVRTLHEQFPPIKLIHAEEDGKPVQGEVVDSLIAGGCIIEGAKIMGSILSPNVNIGARASVVNSVIMEGVTIGARAKIKNAIVDKEVCVPPGAQIGYDLVKDRKRFDVTTSGIVIVPKRVLIQD
ncbi:MAG TPA: glucose-1-phosphate adenylyltransferase [Candidatus Omnitrophota bacterium]|nr:glucose-1-phosphate adenylyltransferase [Candidatus Omnitrophota bacterium]HQO58570.1 glucose-1-phosphate adenylyltransferase [Candidatus Omnitrophota bacterium]HQP12577.1 glucose-1-phosphate adenylyltransferase [Candidatus Omnitrophota bacterium]